MDIDAINRMDPAAFVTRFGGLFEHSPWVAQRALAARPFASVADMHKAMTAVVDRASRDDQVTLLRAHPDLAGKEAQEGSMTDASVAEQASVGLDRLTRDEVLRIAELNAAYRAKHGFPFIIAVRQNTKDAIFREFARRLDNDSDTERRAALDQVAAITRLRLAAVTEVDHRRAGDDSANPRSN